MPTILFRDNPDVSSDCVMKIAVYAEYVASQCFDVFGDDGTKSRSQGLALKAREVSDALDFGDKPHFSPETIQRVVELRSAVFGMCFDKFGERGQMGKSLDLLRMDQDVSDVLDRLVIFELSDAEIEEVDADWDHESQFYASTAVALDAVRRHGAGSPARA